MILHIYADENRIVKYLFLAFSYFKLHPCIQLTFITCMLWEVSSPGFKTWKKFLLITVVQHV